jgi:hypothetical protein
MSDTKDNGGPAFPNMPPIDHPGGGSAGGYPYPAEGASMRDYFAAKAMQSLLVPVGLNLAPAIAAKAAYDYADAMLEARK